MKPTNMPSGAQRNAEVGLVWIEILTNAQGSFQLPFQATFRVRATGATTVTIGGTLAMTMSAGEIAIFNAGTGPSDTLSYTTIVIAGANAFVQKAADIESGRIRR